MKQTDVLRNLSARSSLSFASFNFLVLSSAEIVDFGAAEALTCPDADTGEGEAGFDSAFEGSGAFPKSAFLFCWSYISNSSTHHSNTHRN
jgi:hypothetical protein